VRRCGLDWGRQSGCVVSAWPILPSAQVDREVHLLGGHHDARRAAGTTAAGAHIAVAVSLKARATLPTPHVRCREADVG
jgi:hypothetical protein